MRLFLWQRESKTVKNVRHHMTTREKWRLYLYQGLYGAWYGLTVALPFGFLVACVSWSLRPPPDVPEWMTMPFFYRTPWPIALGVLLVGVAINIPVVIYLQRKLKRFLASSKWARSQGYTVDDL